MSDKLRVVGGKPLKGTIKVSGSKNAAVALIPASLLSRGIVTFNNVPDIEDIRILLEVVEMMGATYQFESEQLIIDSSKIKNIPLTDPKINALRASTYFMGVCLALFNEVEIIAPGGCKIGERPIDFHLEAFKQLGVQVERTDTVYHLYSSSLSEAIITLPYPSVGTTINILLATFFIDGVSIIENVALEPEVEEVIDFLTSIGGNITGKGQCRLVVSGARIKKSQPFMIMPDRIEAGTYAILGAMIGDNLRIEGFRLEHSFALLNIFNKLGVDYQMEDEVIIVNKSDNLSPLSLKTHPYPYFPTDLQQPLTVLLGRATSTSVIEDTVYKKRLGHLEELQKLNYIIRQVDHRIYIDNSKNLKPSEVEGRDLRGSAALIIALLSIEGESLFTGYKYLKRGYVDMINKLQKVGGNINVEETSI